MISKIRLYCLQDRCNALKVEGKSNAAIAKILTNECGKPISEMTMSRFFGTRRKKVGEIISVNHKLSERVAEHEVNINDELFGLLEVIKEAIAEAKTAGGTPERRAPLFMAALKSIELISRRLEGFDEPAQNVFISVQRTPL